MRLELPLGGVIRPDRRPDRRLVQELVHRRQLGRRLRGRPRRHLGHARHAARAARRPHRQPAQLADRPEGLAGDMSTHPEALSLADEQPLGHQLPRLPGRAGDVPLRAPPARRLRPGGRDAARHRPEPAAAGAARVTRPRRPAGAADALRTTESSPPRSSRPTTGRAGSCGSTTCRTRSSRWVSSGASRNRTRVPQRHVRSARRGGDRRADDPGVGDGDDQSRAMTRPETAQSCDRAI